MIAPTATSGLWSTILKHMQKKTEKINRVILDISNNVKGLVSQAYKKTIGATSTYKMI